MATPNIPGLLLNTAHPLSRGLVGWWPMNEGAGERVNDISPYQNPGLFGNIAPSATSGWSGGPHGRAVQFDGSDDIVSVPHAPQLALTGDMTAAAWVFHTSTANYRSILIKGHVGAGYPAPFHMFVEITTGKVLFYFGNGSSQTGIDTPTMPLGSWAFVCGTRLGSTITVYINGRYALSGSLGAQAVTDAGTALGIGSRTPGTAYPMLGGIANARLYNRALSAAEVAELYANPMAGARAPFSLPRSYLYVSRPKSADRLHNRSHSRIYRRGES